MIRKQLINPESIVVVGGSNDISKPGGRVLHNLLATKFRGDLYVVNRNSTKVQGVKAFNSENQLPDVVDLAILAIPANECVHVVKLLAEKKGTKAFIVLSAGFGEAGDEGKKLEKALVEIVRANDGCLIGPNCIGVLNTSYCGVFTLPIPELSNRGCDLISGSGATAVFLMEAGVSLGVKFSSVFSLGNSAMIGVEEVLEYMDNTFDPKRDAKIKLLYIEHIAKPNKFLKHTQSLIGKGAKIAAIKAGATSAGSRAAASHTGALSSSDVAIRALFRKAGIIYCNSRTELLSIASIFHYGQPPGKNFAIITHAGGSAVMVTDTLSRGGLNVPEIKGPDRDKLQSYLNPGSSVSNPIDFLATGTAEQLGIIIDYCENKFEEIDAMIVVFGSPGLFDVEAVYNVLSVKLDVCRKPIYPVLPSVVNAHREISKFLERGNINFPDEVELGNAIVAIHKQSGKTISQKSALNLRKDEIKKIIDSEENGFLPLKSCHKIVKSLGIATPAEWTVRSQREFDLQSEKLHFPCVMKVVGPVHKTELRGVALNIQNRIEAQSTLDKLLKIEGAKGVLIQPMFSGYELFIGAKRESTFGHVIFCGFGGIFIELIQDFSTELTPVSHQEAMSMIENLRGYPILQGYRGLEGINTELFASYIERISALVMLFPEIAELDLNPLMANGESLIAVDVRIKIDRNL